MSTFEGVFSGFFLCGDYTEKRRAAGCCPACPALRLRKCFVLSLQADGETEVTVVAMVVTGGRRRAGMRYNMEVPVMATAVVDVMRSVVALVVRAGVVVPVAGSCLTVVGYFGAAVVCRFVLWCSLCYGRKSCQDNE